MGSGDVRLASLIAVISLASLSRSHWGVIDELEEMLAVASNNSKLLAVLAHGIELVGESSLELLAGNVGELSLSNKGLGLCAYKFLLKYNDLGRVWLLVLELRNLIGNLLLT